MRSIRAASVCFVLFMMGPASLEAQTQPAPAGPERFVQQFLDWYVSQTGWRTVLQQQRFAVQPGLRALLQAEVDAQERSGGEVGALDFDPFLASQDPCEHYKTGEVTRTGTRYLVEIYGTCSSSGGIPDAMFELEQSDSSWAIANLQYPGLDTDLLTLLRESEEDRQ